MKRAAALHDADTNYVSVGSDVTNDGEVKVERLDGQRGGEKVLDKIFMSSSKDSEKKLEPGRSEGLMRGRLKQELMFVFV